MSQFFDIEASDDLVRGIRDREQLRLLSVGLLILSIVTGLYGLFPLVHVMMGLSLMANPEMGSAGMVFVGIGSAFIVVFEVMALGMFIASRSIGVRRRRTLCIAVLAIMCLAIPIGTIVGVLGIAALTRPSVRTLFDRPLEYEE